MTFTSSPSGILRLCQGPLCSRVSAPAALRGRHTHTPASVPGASVLSGLCTCDPPWSVPNSWPPRLLYSLSPASGFSTLLSYLPAVGDHDTCSPGLCGLCPLPGFAFGRRPLGRTGPCPTGPPPSWRYRDASQGRNKAVAGGLGVGGLAINCFGGASGVALYSNKNLDDEGL